VPFAWYAGKTGGEIKQPVADENEAAGGPDADYTDMGCDQLQAGDLVSQAPLSAPLLAHGTVGLSV
jgi:hypothetical protein